MRGAVGTRPLPLRCDGYPERPKTPTSGWRDWTPSHLQRRQQDLLTRKKSPRSSMPITSLSWASLLSSAQRNFYQDQRWEGVSFGMCGLFIVYSVRLRNSVATLPARRALSLTTARPGQPVKSHVQQHWPHFHCACSRATVRGSSRATRQRGRRPCSPLRLRWLVIVTVCNRPLVAGVVQGADHPPRHRVPHLSVDFIGRSDHNHSGLIEFAYTDGPLESNVASPNPPMQGH